MAGFAFQEWQRGRRRVPKMSAAGRQRRHTGDVIADRAPQLAAVVDSSPRARATAPPARRDGSSDDAGAPTDIRLAPNARSAQNAPRDPAMPSVDAATLAERPQRRRARDDRRSRVPRPSLESRGARRANHLSAAADGARKDKGHLRSVQERCLTRCGPTSVTPRIDGFHQIRYLRRSVEPKNRQRRRR